MPGRINMFQSPHKKFEIMSSKNIFPVPYESKATANRKHRVTRNIHIGPLQPGNISKLATMEEKYEIDGNYNDCTPKSYAMDSSSSSDCSCNEDVNCSSSCSSFRSGHSTPSEVGGDSGVSSEHDTTPPLNSRKPTRIISSDSDNDSSLSSESAADSVIGPSISQIAKLHLLKPPKKLSSKSKAKFDLESQRANTVAPDSLLKEIKEKYREFKRRRKSQRGDNLSSAGERNLLSRSTSYQRSGRLSRLHNMMGSLPQDLSTLSLSASSSFSSMNSIYTEEEDHAGASYWPVSIGDYKVSLYECPDKRASCGFAGVNDIFAPQQESTIKSYKGTVRGVKNRVRAGIATFTSDQRFLKVFAERERGKVVVFLTTLGIIRETYERCLRVRKILWTLLVHFEERDIFMSRDNQLQLLDRLNARRVTVPHIFLEGQYLGGVELIERLNESGELRRLLQPYMDPTSLIPCDTCGGFRLLPCTVCSGSKKSVHRNDFTLEFVALKCSSCDESGLVQCQDCCSPSSVQNSS